MKGEGAGGGGRDVTGSEMRRERVAPVRRQRHTGAPAWQARRRRLSRQGPRGLRPPAPPPPPLSRASAAQPPSASHTQTPLNHCPPPSSAPPASPAEGRRQRRRRCQSCGPPGAPGRKRGACGIARDGRVFPARKRPHLVGRSLRWVDLCCLGVGSNCLQENSTGSGSVCWAGGGRKTVKEEGRRGERSTPPRLCQA